MGVCYAVVEDAAAYKAQKIPRIECFGVAGVVLVGWLKRSPVRLLVRLRHSADFIL